MHAIRAAHAFDGTRFLPGGATVLVDGGRIAGVGPRGGELPPDVVLVEHAGTVLPGLFDCHTHLVADGTMGGLERAGAMTDEEMDAVIASSLRAHAAAGVTTVRDLGDRHYRTLAFRDRPGLPRVVAAGPPLTTPGGHCHFLGGAAAGDGLLAAVTEHADRGVDVVKVMASGGFATPGSDQMGAQFTVAELEAVVATAHARGLPVTAHSHSLIGIRNAVAAGVDGIEHFTGLTTDGSGIDDALLEEVARRGIAVDPTMGNDRSLHDSMPEPPPAVLALMARLGFRSFAEVYAAQLALLSRLRAHGVNVVVGVDSGMGPMKPHGNAWRMVADLVEAGYTVEEALAAATSAAAEACRLVGETGRLAAGLAADVVVVDGDLSQDPLALSHPREVWIRGDQVSLA